MAKFIDRPISFGDLQNAAIAVATAYRNAGWIVRAYLPQQEITGDTVTIQIVEAKLGAVRIEGNTKRISSEQVKSIIEDAQAPGTPMNAKALDLSLIHI